MIVMSVLTRAQSPIGHWESLVPYRSCTTLAERDGFLLAGCSDSWFFSLDPDLRTMQSYSNLDGYTSREPVVIRYDSLTQHTILAYRDGNLDLVKGATIYNLPGIKNNLIYTEKDVFEIVFWGHTAWLATSFGIVLLDLERREFKEDFTLGSSGSAIKVFDLVINGNTVYAATENGLYSTHLDDANFDNYLGWQLIDTGPALFENAQVIFFNDEYYFSDESRLYKRNAQDQFIEIFSVSGDERIQRLDASNDRLLLILYAYDGEEISGAKFIRIDTLGHVEEIEDPYIDRPLETYTAANGDIYFADVWHGLVRLQNGAAIDLIRPDAPPSSNCRQVAVYDHKLFVAPGGVTLTWNYGSGNNEGFFYRDDTGWHNPNPNDNSPLYGVSNIACTAYDPTLDKAYFGSYGNGLVILSGNDISHTADGYGLQPHAADGTTFRITGMAIDNDHNLWINSFAANRPLSVITPDGQWANFDLPPTTPNNDVSNMILDEEGRLWTILVKTGILVYDSGSDPLGDADDQAVFLGVGAGKGGLHTKIVFALAKDLEGEIWAGTEDGITIFYCPYQIFDGGCDASRPILEGEDGSGSYLLAGQSVLSIAVDGANRKWVGTANGLFLLSSDGHQTIHYFTMENSPLLSNVIYSIDIDQITGEVYIATDGGINVYQSDAGLGTHSFEEVRVYPNPVRQDYTGPVAIKGLAQNADVRITDVTGNLVFRTTALGGQAIWDARSLSGERVATGVYLIWCNNADATESFVTKVFVVN